MALVCIFSSLGKVLPSSFHTENQLVQPPSCFPVSHVAKLIQLGSRVKLGETRRNRFRLCSGPLLKKKIN